MLPSGTHVEIKIQKGYYLDITITPSLNDWNQVEGKCGTYNDITYDDFTDRNGNIVGQTDFIKSWRYVFRKYIFNALIFRNFYRVKTLIRWQKRTMRLTKYKIIPF